MTPTLFRYGWPVAVSVLLVWGAAGCKNREAAEAKERREAWQVASQHLTASRSELLNLSLFPGDPLAVVKSGGRFSCKGHAFGRDAAGRTERLSWSCTLARDQKTEKLHPQSTSSGGRRGIGVSPSDFVALVPFGPESEAAARDLSAYFRERMLLPITVLSPIPVPPGATDPGRAQAASEALIAGMRSRYGGRTPRGSILIGITARDIFSRDDGALRFVFSTYHRDAAMNSFAVLSTARLAHPERSRSRLRKMATRIIGELRYDLPRNANPSSFLYAPLLSADDIDRMSDGFLF